MNSNRRWRGVGFLGVLFAVLLFASDAFALDAYESRKNIFAGISAGGGYGFVHQEKNLLEQGPGMQVQGVVGGGVTDRFTLGLELDWWSRSVDKGTGDQYALHHGSIGGVGNLFLLGGFHLDAGAGFAYGICNGDRRDRNCKWRELGLEGEAGLGYEFWLTGNLAAGADLSYTHHFYSQTAFDTFSLTFGVRWY